ncbi:hypothetical protein SDC9_113933 [bioreactor metagenome]|uniref:Uncharacterized protein n=1 Tax=bioreactor metagenome TaxID=1076179 RepID=A0A645BPG6_9ZZZZ
MDQHSKHSLGGDGGRDETPLHRRKDNAAPGVEIAIVTHLQIPLPLRIIPLQRNLGRIDFVQQRPVALPRHKENRLEPELFIDPFAVGGPPASGHGGVDFPLLQGLQKFIDLPEFPELIGKALFPGQRIERSHSAGPGQHPDPDAIPIDVVAGRVA